MHMDGAASWRDFGQALRRHEHADMRSKFAVNKKATTAQTVATVGVAAASCSAFACSITPRGSDGSARSHRRADPRTGSMTASLLLKQAREGTA